MKKILWINIVIILLCVVIQAWLDRVLINTSSFKLKKCAYSKNNFLIADEGDNLLSEEFSFIKNNPFFPGYDGSSDVGARRSPKVDRGKGKIRPDSNKVIFDCRGVVKLGDKLIALIKVSDKDKIFFVGKGQSVCGYNVLDISQNEIVLCNGGSSEKIRLKVGGKDQSDR